jgi:hypothetical protein
MKHDVNHDPLSDAIKARDKQSRKLEELVQTIAASEAQLSGLRNRLETFGDLDDRIAISS